MRKRILNIADCKYKFKEDRKNNYNCDDKNYHTSNDDIKNNALKVLTVLSS